MDQVNTASTQSPCSSQSIFYHLELNRDPSEVWTLNKETVTLGDSSETLQDLSVTGSASDVNMDDCDESGSTMSPLLREDRPRSMTWPLPRIKDEEDGVCGELVVPQNQTDDLMDTPAASTVQEDRTIGSSSKVTSRKNSRKNPWGPKSYAQLIVEAIQSSPEKRLTLGQIYDFMVKNYSYFGERADQVSSAGWKNSIRHNLSLHSRFVRVVNDNSSKSAFWVVLDNPPAQKSMRRRSGSVDSTSPKSRRLKRKSKSPGLASTTSQSTTSLTAYPSAASPASSNESLLNLAADGFVDFGGAVDVHSASLRHRSDSQLSSQSSLSHVSNSVGQGGFDLDHLGSEDITVTIDGQYSWLGLDAGEGTTLDAKSWTLLESCSKSTSAASLTYYGFDSAVAAAGVQDRPHSDSLSSSKSNDSGYESPKTVTAGGVSKQMLTSNYNASLPQTSSGMMMSSGSSASTGSMYNGLMQQLGAVTVGDTMTVPNAGVMNNGRGFGYQCVGVGVTCGPGSPYHTSSPLSTGNSAFGRQGQRSYVNQPTSSSSCARFSSYFIAGQPTLSPCSNVNDFYGFYSSSSDRMNVDNYGGKFAASAPSAAYAMGNAGAAAFQQPSLYAPNMAGSMHTYYRTQAQNMPPTHSFVASDGLPFDLSNVNVSEFLPSAVPVEQLYNSCYRQDGGLTDFIEACPLNDSFAKRSG